MMTHIIGHYEELLRLYWSKFTTRFGVPVSNAERVYDEIRSRYGEPHRKYHGIKHPVLLFQKLELFCHSDSAPKWLLDDRDPKNIAVELAIWDHDLFYDAKESNNEEKSAYRAIGHARDLGFSAEVGVWAKSYILATKHTFAPLELGAQMVVDIDLSLLADPWEDFAQSSRDIRQEYEHVSDEDFVRGRRDFLRGMLARQRIYSTPYFFRELEKKARSNLERSLKEQFALEG